MGLGFGIRVTGDKATQRGLERLSRAVGPDGMTRMMNQALFILQGEVQRTTTGGNPLNVQTGRLRSSWQKGGGGNVRTIQRKGSNTEGTLGSNVRYAAIHEFGGRAGRGGATTIPARRYVSQAREAAEAKIRNHFSREIDRVVKRFGV